MSLSQGNSRPDSVRGTEDRWSQVWRQTMACEMGKVSFASSRNTTSIQGFCLISAIAGKSALGNTKTILRMQGPSSGDSNVKLVEKGMI